MGSKTEAQALLNNKLLGELFDTYKVSLFGLWMEAQEIEQQRNIHARGMAVGDMQMWIESKAKDILNGSD